MTNNTRNILLIDDQKITYTIIERIFNDDNTNIVYIDEIELSTFPELILSIKPNIILLDLNLNNLSGIDILKKIKSDKRIKSIPVIILSVIEIPEKKKECFKFGANDYIVKLPDKVELISRINYHISVYNKTIFHRKVLETVNSLRKIQSDFVNNYDYENSFNTILKEFSDITNNSYGVILNTQSINNYNYKFSIMSIYEKENYHDFDNLISMYGDSFVISEDSKNIWGNLLLHKKQIIINDVSKTDYCKNIPSIHPIIGSFLAIPLISSNNLIGVILLANKEVNDYKLLINDILIDAIVDTCSTILTMYNEYNLRIQAESELRISELNFQRIIESTSDAIIWINEKGKIVFWNKGAKKLFGYSKEQIIGKTYSKLLPDKYYKLLELGDDSNIKIIGDDKVQVIGLTQTGKELPIELTYSYCSIGSKYIYSIIIRDITERIEIEKKLEKQANNDELTGLPNRRLFNETLKQSISWAKRSDDKVILMFIDLDRFKQINDTIGHKYGDELLIETSNRLTSCVRRHDIVARLGGDEFTIILTDLGDNYELTAASVADKILKRLSEPFYIKDKELFISGSIGITVFPNDATSKDDLIKNADVAMYKSKSLGRNTFSFFTEEMGIESKTIMSIENELRKAIRDNELFLVFQPILNIKKGKVDSLEALLRWNNKKLGFIPPDVFIPVAEKTGLINDIGKWVLLKACEDSKPWIDAGIINNISINVSTQQISNLINDINFVLEKTKIDPVSIKLEITETNLMVNIIEFTKVIEYISNLGISISIDDFGTGYSSLSYLKKINASALKVDKSFILDIIDDKDDKAIVKSISSMAKHLKIETVAEGIETIEHLETVRKLNLTYAQGYFFSKPIRKEGVKDLVNSIHKEIKNGYSK